MRPEGGRRKEGPCAGTTAEWAALNISLPIPLQGSKARFVPSQITWGGWREGNLGRDALGSRVGCAASLTKRHINIAMHFCHIDVGSRELRKALFFFAFLALFFFSYGPEEDQANGSLR